MSLSEHLCIAYRLTSGLSVWQQEQTHWLYPFLHLWLYLSRSVHQVPYTRHLDAKNLPITIFFFSHSKKILLRIFINQRLKRASTLDPISPATLSQWRPPSSVPLAHNLSPIPKLSVSISIASTPSRCLSPYPAALLSRYM